MISLIWNWTGQHDHYQNICTQENLQTNTLQNLENNNVHENQRNQINNPTFQAVDTLTNLLNLHLYIIHVVSFDIIQFYM